jgi:hypothetical protein
MRSSSLSRLAFGAIVLLAVALPAAFTVWRGDRVEMDLLGRYVKGPGLENVKVLPWDTGRPALEASIAGCRGRVQIFALSASMDDERNTERRYAQSGVRTFLYVDGVWPVLDHITVWTTYARAQAANVIREHPIINLDNIVEIVAPPGCDALHAMDLRGFWDSAQPAP